MGGRVPEEEANGAGLRLQYTKGGRIARAIPDLKTLTVGRQVFEALREDTAWLGSVLEDEQRIRDEPVDPHHEPVSETSPEGREAIALANKRLREDYARPRNTREAGWGD